MVSVALRVRHGHCSHCGTPTDELFLLDITAGQPLTIRPADTHAGLCAACICELGLQALAAGGKVLEAQIHRPPPPPARRQRAAPAPPSLRQPSPTRRMKG